MCPFARYRTERDVFFFPSAVFSSFALFRLLGICPLRSGQRKKIQRKGRVFAIRVGISESRTRLRDSFFCFSINRRPSFVGRLQETTRKWPAKKKKRRRPRRSPFFVRCDFKKKKKIKNAHGAKGQRNRLKKNTNETTERAMNSVPCEMVVAILGRVDAIWLPVASHVCRTWHACALHVASRRGDALRVRCGVMRQALERGLTPTVFWLHTALRYPWSSEMAAAAARCGQEATLLRMISAGCPVDASVMPAALVGGGLELVKRLWLLKERVPWDERTMIVAVAQGDVGTVRWLVMQGCPRGRLPVVVAIVRRDQSCLDALGATTKSCAKARAVIDNARDAECYSCRCVLLVCAALYAAHDPSTKFASYIERVLSPRSMDIWQLSPCLRGRYGDFFLFFLCTLWFGASFFFFFKNSAPACLGG